MSETESNKNVDFKGAVEGTPEWFANQVESANESASAAFHRIYGKRTDVEET